MSNALSLGVCFLILGRLGAFTPDFPGVPVYDFLNLSGPIAMCGETTVAILPADVAPAVATSFKLIDIISVIFILLFIFHQSRCTFTDCVLGVWYFKIFFAVYVTDLVLVNQQFRIIPVVMIITFFNFTEFFKTHYAHSLQ